MADAPLAGGCQCGAVRFRAGSLGRASICHCRMCQKAFGGFFGTLVTAHDLEWTRGTPRHFQSSNKVRRGFCGDCGTPLSYDFGGPVEIAIGAFDDPARAAPTIQVNLADRIAFFEELCTLPVRAAESEPEAEAFKAAIVSYQHPDHDTAEWPPRQR
ncbi:MAG: GFA family protein [Pseudorhodoplanes sp.]|nr:GFA family protein [Pseudorhodoplanes sp.]